VNKPPLQQQAGVLQVSQSVFRNMVGVSVTSNVAKSCEVGENVTGTVKDSVTTSPGGLREYVTTVTTASDTVTTTPSGVGNSATSTSTDNITTTPTGVGNNATTTDENVINTLTVTENNVTSATNNVIVTPSGVGDIVTIDTRDSINIIPSKIIDDVTSEAKDNVIDTTDEHDIVTTTPSRVGDTVSNDKINTTDEQDTVTATPNRVGDTVNNDKINTTDEHDTVTATPSRVGDTVNNENKDAIMSAAQQSDGVSSCHGNRQQSDDLLIDNEPCNDDVGCHGNHHCSDTKNECDVEHVSATISSTISSHDAKVDGIGYDISDVAPPPNEALTPGEPLVKHTITQWHCYSYIFRSAYPT